MLFLRTMKVSPRLSFFFLTKINLKYIDIIIESYQPHNINILKFQGFSSLGILIKFVFMEIKLVVGLPNSLHRKVSLLF